MYYYFKRTTYKRRFEALLKNNTQKLTVVKNPKSSTTIPDYLVDKILEKVLTFEKERGYLDSSITLNSMAKKLETNSNYLSKVVNLTKGRNFSTYISDLRINYTVEALKNQPKLREYTVKAIANEVGFNNTESFTKAFYKNTKLYPSYFIKQLKKKEESNRNTA